MEEVWKPIKESEVECYISNKGRVRVCEKIFRGNRIKINKLTNGTFTVRGYMEITINKKRYYVHRLVAKYFIENKENKKYVNHKDFNTVNNCLENLEWCTHAENIKYSLERGRFTRTSEWKDNCKESQIKLKGRKVVQYSGVNKVMEYRYLNEVKLYGFNPPDVHRSCNKKTKVKGYNFFYKEEEHLIDFEEIKDGNRIKVIQYDLEGKFIKEYKSMKEAATMTGTNPRSISHCCSNKRKTANNYKWEKKNIN